jgi:hypothetical protein
MRSLPIIALATCLVLFASGCGSGDKEKPSLDKSPGAGDEAASTAEVTPQDANDKDERHNPIMYGPHTGIVAVLLQTDPWLTVIGSETPTVAVYADGTVVYLGRLPDQTEWRYFEAKLTGTGLENLRKKLGPTEAFMALEGFTDLAPDTTDQPRTKIYLSDGTHTKAVSVRGYVSTARRAEIQRQFPDAAWPEYERLPEFDRVYNALTALHSDDAREWEPWYVELYIYGPWSLDDWRREHQSRQGFGPDKPYVDPKPWPHKWPTFINLLTWDWGDGSYSLYLAGSSLDEVRRFFASPSTGGGVLIEGRVYCATYRYAFPGEGTYADAFDEAEKDDNPGRLGL